MRVVPSIDNFAVLHDPVPIKSRADWLIDVTLLGTRFIQNVITTPSQPADCHYVAFM